MGGFRSWFLGGIFDNKKPAPPPAAPPPPDYSKITADTLRAQMALAPELYASEANPLYGQIGYANLQNQVNDILLSGQMGQLAKSYPQIAGIETDYEARLRRGELEQITSPELGLSAYKQAFNQLTPGYEEAVAGMGQLAKTATEQSLAQPTYTAYEQAVGGPSYGQYVGQVGGPSADLTLGGMQAYKFGGTTAAPYQVGQEFLNQPSYQSGLYTGQVRGPQTQSQLGQIDTGLVGSYMNQMPGVSKIAEGLSKQAQQDLAAGRSLTPEEARLATQSAREAYAARGTALGPQAIQAEILNRAELGNQRYRERQAAAAQAAGTISNLYTPALQQAYQRQAGAEAYNLGAQGQQFGQAMSQEDMARMAQAQQFSQLGAKEQALAEAQGQQFAQGMTQEDILRQSQAQEYGQRLGLQELGINLQGQQYQQAMGKEGLAQQTQNQALQQALQRTQQGIAGQQSMLGLQAQRAQLAASAMASLQGAQAPILQAFYNQPILSNAVPQAQQFALGGQQASGPALYNPESSMSFQTAFMPYQAGMAERNATIQANATMAAGNTAAKGQMMNAAMTAAAMY
jgi:hypothetical protein